MKLQLPKCIRPLWIIEVYKKYVNTEKSSVNKMNYITLIDDLFKDNSLFFIYLVYFLSIYISETYI